MLRKRGDKIRGGSSGKEIKNVKKDYWHWALKWKPCWEVYKKRTSSLMDEGNKDWSVLIKSLTAYEGFQTDDSLITRGEWMDARLHLLLPRGWTSPGASSCHSHHIRSRRERDLHPLFFLCGEFTSTILWPIFLPTLLSKFESRWRQKSKKDFYIFFELNGAE